MSIKELLFKKKIKQVEIAKELKIEPSRVSLFITGVRPLPEKYHRQLAKLLNISIEELTAHLGGKNG